MSRPRIAIIGGGFTGLVTAYRLVKQGVDVTIYEANDRLGGLAAGTEVAGHRVEQAYHFLYKTDEYILGLVDELVAGPGQHESQQTHEQQLAFEIHASQR